MFKKVMIASSVLSIVSVLALADAKVTPIDVKADTIKFIDNMIVNQDKVGGWVVSDRVKRDNQESFRATFTPIKNQVMRQKDMEGLAFDTEVTYDKDSLKAISTLSALPTDVHLRKAEKKLVDDIIKDKVVEITTNYSAKDYKFDGRLKDINQTINGGTIVTKDIGFNGSYNPNDILAQDSSFFVKSIDLTPPQDKLKGEFVSIKDIKINSSSQLDGQKLNLKTHISIASVDAKVMKQISDVKNLTLDTTIANLDVKSYKELIELIQNNPTNYIEDPKLFPLLTELLTAEGISINIDNLSVDNLIAKGQNMGKGKITAKVSLKNDPNLAKMIAMSPLMALSALQVEANIELSQDMFNALMKDKRAFMLGMLPQKKVGDMIVYKIDFKDGKLLINGKELAPPARGH